MRRPIRFRTIRQRRRRARAAQVSAIAVVLGLMLVVTFIANFVLLQLPGQMANLENQHVLLVENQLSQLQATILSEERHAKTFLPVNLAVTLGSQAAPPFGPPVIGTIQADPTPVKTLTRYTVAEVFPKNISFLNGDPCGGSCHPNTFVVYNQSLTGGDSSLTLNNGGILWNLTGNNTNVTITWKGNTYQPNASVIVVVNGSNDHVTYLKDGQGSQPPVQFFFYGQYDTFAASANGQNALNLSVTFVGTLDGRICPNANLSNTDSITALAGNPNWVVNVTWWNFEGYVTRPHTVTDSSGDVVTFQNRSGFVACAFTAIYPSTYTMLAGGGLVVHSTNRYTPQSDVALDEGAVILAQSGGTPIMVNPPPFSVVRNGPGLTGELTLMNFVGTPKTDSGTTAAWVTAQVLSVTSLTISNGFTGSQFLTGLNFTVTTPYPLAWKAFFASMPIAFPSQSFCLAPLPASCAGLQPGQLATLQAPFAVSTLKLILVTVELTIN